MRHQQHFTASRLQCSDMAAEAWPKQELAWERVVPRSCYMDPLGSGCARLALSITTAAASHPLHNARQADIEHISFAGMGYVQGQFSGTAALDSVSSFQQWTRNALLDA